MKKLYLISLLILISTFSFAQHGIIKGRIFNDDNETLPGANIIIDNNYHLGTASDINGGYIIKNIPAGKHTIKVSYIGYSDAIIDLTIEEGETKELNIELIAGVELETVVINSRLIGESKALNAQKNNLNITNIVSKEQLDRFPDGNIGDALKRITGINVQYDQGEARFGNIRGTAPELNSITINGERIPSAEAEIRSVQLDLVSSDMIETVEFNKALTPDMDADAIGGSINLVTKQAPYERELKVKLGTRYNFIAEKPSYKGKISYGQRFLNNKLGIVLSASLNDNRLGSDDLEAEWDYQDNNDNGNYDKGETIFPNDLQVRQYYLERLRQSYAASFDYKINDNHTLFINALYNKREDWENRFRFRLKKIKPQDDGTYKCKLIRQTKFGVEDNKYGRLENQRMMNYGFGGKHTIGIVKLDWLASYSKANEERPNERYIQYDTKTAVTLDLDDLREPKFNILDEKFRTFNNEWDLDELTEEYQYTEEIDKNFRINAIIPMMTGEYANQVKVGVRYRGKEKMRDNWYKEFSPLDEDGFSNIVFDNLTDETRDNYMAGDYEIGSFVDPEISDEIDLSNTSQFESELVKEEEAGDFNAEEDIFAGYVMLTQRIRDKVSVIAGVRVEQTNLEYQGYQYHIENDELTQTEKIKDDYINVLPGIHINYTPNLSSNIRFAWTNTLARPNYYDLVPYKEINRDDSEIKIGNPELKPTKSMNLDLTYEYFFKNIGIASAGVFYKNLKDVISWRMEKDYEFAGHTYNIYRKPDNIADANLYGFEMSFSRRLDFLPSFLRNLTFYSNYTYAKSKLENIQIEGRKDEDLPLSGSPEHTYNLSLAYDTKKFDMRISFNHASAFLNTNDDGGLGSEEFFDFYYDKVNYLDFNANYKFNKNWKVYFNANNLLNQPLRTYFGDVERTAQDEYYGVKLQLGVKYTL